MAKAADPHIPTLADELDHRAAEMLQAIQENDHAATTTEIRDATNLDNNQVQYRRRKLKEHGLITVEDSRTHDNRIPPKRHRLTDKGEKALAAGLLDEFGTPEPGGFDELARQVARLTERVDDLAERVGDTESSVTNAHRKIMRVGGDTARYSNRRPLDERIDELEEEIERLDKEKKGKRF